MPLFLRYRFFFMRQRQCVGYCSQTLVPRPDFRHIAQGHCGQQVGVDIANTMPHECMSFDEEQYLVVEGECCLKVNF